MSKKNINKKKRLTFSLFAVSSIFSMLLWTVFLSLNSAINVPTLHLDGAFQTASGLFRIGAGQVPGRDFFPYLGIGPLVLIFPFFKIAGGDLSASVFAAKFVTLILGWGAVSVLWHLIFRPRKAVSSFVGGAVVFVTINSVAYYVNFINPLLFGFEPGNSLRPVRAVIPYVIAIASYFLIKNVKNKLERNILAGIVVGISLLWSNDFAIPTAGFFGLFYVLLFYLEKNSNWKKSLITFFLSAMISFFCCFFLLTDGHLIELMKYNFIDVAGDQWWYFAPYGVSSRVFEIGHVVKLVSRENLFPIIVLSVVSIYALKTKKIEHVLVFMIGLVLFSGGTLASLGGHLGRYYGAFYYWGAILSILVVLRCLSLYVKKHCVNLQLKWLIVPVFFVLFIATYYEFRSYQQNFNIAKSDSERDFIPEFGGYLGIEWRGYINYARRHQESNVVEDYWGLWSSFNKRFSPWPVDSTIHALGSVRERAKSSLEKSDLIITTRYTTSERWQPWGLSQNFWFYEDLLTSWEPDFISPTTVVWRKMDKQREYENIDCQISRDGHGFILNSEYIGFYKVTLNYVSTGSGRYLLMVQNNISYGADANGFVSLQPGSFTTTIPTLISHDSGRFFNVKIVGGKNVGVEIKSCLAKRITYSNNEILYMRD